MKTMNLLTLLFLAALLSHYGIELWLSLRQARRVRAHRARVPEAFAASISLAAHQKAADYTLASLRFGRVEQAAGVLLLLAWTLGGGLDALDRAWRSPASDLPGPIATGLAVLLSAGLVMALLDLPFAAWRTFVLEQRFGFNRADSRLFVTDTLKQWLLGLAFGAPLIAGALWLMQTGPRWWLWVWLLWLGFSLFMLWAWPTLIAPLFNRFSALADEGLRVRIERLLARCGFASDGVFVMDGSRRSAHGNAYFTGLGRHKRIVFFDTLINTLDGDEIEAVLAHELGHFRRRHVQKRMAFMALASLAALALLGWLRGETGFFTGLGVVTPSDHMALLLFMLALPPFTALLSPLFARVSRRHEFEADAYAAEHSDGRALIAALVKLYRDNAATLTPDPLYSAWHDSHPPAPVRIAHLRAKLVTT
jgi:STE24 endopeptidase